MRLTARLVALLAVACLVGGACQVFSGTDEPASDAGVVDTGAAPDAPPTADGSTPDTSVPDAADAAVLDAPASPCSLDAGLAYCESFEGAGASCGLSWHPMNGSATRITGLAHGGAQFCRFCANAPAAQLQQGFAFAGRSNYLLSAWVRLAAHPDASAPPSTTQQLLAYDDAGNQIGRDDEHALPSPAEWRQIQSTLSDAAAGTREDIYFYPEPFGNAVGDCIDIDDVTLTAE